MPTLPELLLCVLYLLIDFGFGYLMMVFFLGKPKTKVDYKKILLGATVWTVVGTVLILFLGM